MEEKPISIPEPLAELDQLRRRVEIYELALSKIASGSSHYTWSMVDIARDAIDQAEAES